MSERQSSRVMPELPVTDGVEYRLSAEYPGHCIGSDGSVWTCACSRNEPGWFAKSWKQRKGCPNSDNGRLYLRIARRGQKHLIVYVHRMIAMAFHGPPPFDGAFARHLNDIYLDNRADNLAWGTRLENARDAIRNGRRPRGEQHQCTTVSDAAASEFIRRVLQGEQIKAVAEEVGIRHKTARLIISRHSFRYAGDGIAKTLPSGSWMGWPDSRKALVHFFFDATGISACSREKPATAITNDTSPKCKWCLRLINERWEQR